MKNIPSDFCDCFLCSHFCVWSCVVVMKEDCSNILVRLNSPEMHLQDFKCWRYRPEIMVLSCVTVSIKITLSATESDHDLPSWRANLKFVLPKRSWTMPFEWLSFHAVHTDASICHPQWRSVKESFHLQACNWEDLFPHIFVLFN